QSHTDFDNELINTVLTWLSDWLNLNKHMLLNSAGTFPVVHAPSCPGSREAERVRVGFVYSHHSHLDGACQVGANRVIVSSASSSTDQVQNRGRAHAVRTRHLLLKTQKLTDG
ncbi:hypothetical protein BaRGS_00026594, partial [Batillaria attramentaria]